MKYQWNCGPLRGECGSIIDLLDVLRTTATHARFVAQDETGAQVVCVDFDPRGLNRFREVPVFSQKEACA